MVQEKKAFPSCINGGISSSAGQIVIKQQQQQSKPDTGKHYINVRSIFTSNSSLLHHYYDDLHNLFIFIRLGRDETGVEKLENQGGPS